MPNKQQIEFVIKPDGSVEERVMGVSGPDCEKITEAIEDALGKVTDRERTSEFYDGKQGTTDAISTGS